MRRRSPLPAAFRKSSWRIKYKFFLLHRTRHLDDVYKLCNHIVTNVAEDGLREKAERLFDHRRVHVLGYTYSDGLTHTRACVHCIIYTAVYGRIVTRSRTQCPVRVRSLYLISPLFKNETRKRSEKKNRPSSYKEL